MRDRGQGPDNFSVFQMTTITKENVTNVEDEKEFKKEGDNTMEEIVKEYEKHFETLFNLKADATGQFYVDKNGTKVLSKSDILRNISSMYLKSREAGDEKQTILNEVKEKLLKQRDVVKFKKDFKSTNKAIEIATKRIYDQYITFLKAHMMNRKSMILNIDEDQIKSIIREEIIDEFVGEYHEKAIEGLNLSYVLGAIYIKTRDNKSTSIPRTI